MSGPTLFHAIADPGSAQVRRWVMDRGLKERVNFRNVAYDEVRADLEAAGGGAVPALLLEGRLVTGPEAIMAALAALSG